MAGAEGWQISTAAAEAYEALIVPAISQAWAHPVAEAAHIAPGQKVLDVACGTGVLAREALKRIGERGQVTGLDLNEGMLAVAARIAPEVDWRQGDAGSLPFTDACFDAVVSQFGLMFFPDRVAALSEMWRTLAPSGRLAVAVWGSIDRAPGYRALVDTLDRQCGPEAAKVLTGPFVLGDETALARLFVDAGVSDSDVALRPGSIRFPTAMAFVNTELKGSPLAESLDDDALQALAADCERALAAYVVPSGEIVMPMDAYIVTAHKP